MDKLSRLQALLGEDDVCDRQIDSGSGVVTVAKAKHLYEGTDSEDEMMQYQPFKGGVSNHDFSKCYFLIQND
jgi:hypothetical protein